MPNARGDTSRVSGARSWSHRFYDWLDMRTGIRGVMHEALDERIPGGASWSYIFGSGLLFLFMSQIITGIFLALYYAPTANYAHVSIAYIIKVIDAGSFLRSVHAYGASAVIIVLILHVAQTYTFGAYKGRRELLWLAGCVLFLLMLGMGFTGYLLPWDQNSYFATTVATNIVAEVPGLGLGLRTLLRGGTEMGTLTVSRFFAIHVFFLPALIFAFLAIHVYLFRKAGAAGPTYAHPITPNLPEESFYPRQIFMDLVFTYVIIIALGLLSFYWPYPLGPVANPADTTFLPRPEWYYRPIFQELKYFPGRYEVVGSMVLPLVVLALMFLVPWIDRGYERRPWKRPLAMTSFFVILFGYVALGAISYWQDQHTPGVAAQFAVQTKEIAQYMHAPFNPVVIGPAVKIATANPLVAKGKGVFDTKGCSGCHGQGGTGTPIAPALLGIGTKFPPAKLADLIRQPTAKMSAAGMPAFVINDSQMNELIAYLDTLK